MGFGKSLRKAVKNTVGGLKQIVKNPTSKEALLSAGALATGGVGAALMATEYAGERARVKAEDEQAIANQQAALVKQNKEAYGYKSMSELVEAQRKKQAKLAEEQPKATGISSLIGRGTTLG